MSSLTSPPAKILLTSSTKVSLHDRFTKLAKTRSQVEPKKKEQTVIAKIGGSGVGRVSQASVRNRNLALQLANKPSVQAALRIKNKSIRQRVGTLVNQAKARVNNKNISNKAAGMRQRVNIGGIDPSRLTIGGVPFVKKNNLSKRLSAGGKPFNNNRIMRVGAGNGAQFGRRLNRSFNKNSTGGAVLNRSLNQRRFKRKRLGNLNTSGTRRNNINNKKNNVNRSMNRKNGKQAQQPPKSRENLDMDLDTYMAKSKSHLDNDLDAYMSQAAHTTN